MNKIIDAYGNEVSIEGLNELETSQPFNWGVEEMREPNVEFPKDQAKAIRTRANNLFKFAKDNDLNFTVAVGLLNQAAEAIETSCELAMETFQKQREMELETNGEVKSLDNQVE